MPWYEGYHDHTPDEKRLSRLGFWNIEAVRDDNGQIPHDTQVETLETTETVQLEPGTTVTHRYRKIHKGYMEGHYIGPNPLLQTEKLMKCSICGRTQWVPVNLNWTAHPKDSPLRTPYQSRVTILRRPAQIDPGSGWTVTKIESLKGLLTFCPEHAAQSERVDQEVNCAISDAIQSALAK